MCESTEDLLASIMFTNQNGDIDKDTVVGSMDVKSLYPSLDIEYTIQIVSDEFKQADLQVESADYDEIGLYVMINRGGQYVESQGLTDYCPQRKRTGRKIEITGRATNLSKVERFEPWKKAKRQPDEVTKKILLTEALKIALNLVLKNHVYQFNNTVRKQIEGEPIRLDLTEVIAKIFMGW